MCLPVLFVSPSRDGSPTLPCAVHLSILAEFFGALILISIDILLALVRMQSE